VKLIIFRFKFLTLKEKSNLFFNNLLNEFNINKRRYKMSNSKLLLTAAAVVATASVVSLSNSEVAEA